MKGKEKEAEKARRLLAGCTPFQQRVYRAVRTIPPGETRSYSWVAGRIGNRRAARAVGQALKRNPLPGYVPCHRVIRADGSPGGFSRGLKEKKRLLSGERRL